MAETHKQIIGVIWEKNQVPGTASITPCTTAFSGTVVNVNCTREQWFRPHVPKKCKPIFVIYSLLNSERNCKRSEN